MTHVLKHILSRAGADCGIAGAAGTREQAGLALDLAQARYNLGLGSIVEFSQAELQKKKPTSQRPRTNTNIA